MPTCAIEDYNRDEDAGKTCVTFLEVNPTSGEINRPKICIDHSSEGEHPNAECDRVCGSVTCIDEYGSQVHCLHWDDDQVEECQEDYGIEHF